MVRSCTGKAGAKQVTRKLYLVLMQEMEAFDYV